TAVRNGDDTPAAILAILGDHAGVSALDIDDQTYTLEGDAAVRHLFSVAASLDSLVVGEPQILGQIEASHRRAQEAGFAGPLLDQTVQAAYRVAKRLRRETDIGRRPVSIAAAAVQTARDLHGDLAKCSGLLIGAGDMGEIIAEALLSSGMANLVVTHPSARRAEGLGRRLDCHVADFDELAKLSAKSEIIVTAMSTRHYVVSEEVLTGAIRERRHRPILLIDTGIPGDTEPGIESLDDAFRYTLDDFERITREGRANREAEAEQAWLILDAELETFLTRFAEREAVPPRERLSKQHDETSPEDEDQNR
ncbi:MAG: glutamyl-tRNA reductase, partial [Proteobacteria bacterium]|nr:glutamyl-tRNA reductase [Pseudomonadota bacterium]